MRTCLITGEYPPLRGGVGDYTRELAHALHAQDIEVGVLTGRQAEKEAREQVVGAPKLFARLDDWGFGSWLRIRQVVNEFKPDILHIQYQTAAYGMHPAINVLPFFMRRMAKRPRLVVTFHDLFPPYLFPKAGPLRDAVAPLLARHCDAVIVTNEEDARLAAGPLGVRKTTGERNLLTRFGLRPLHLVPIGSSIPVVPQSEETRRQQRARLGVDDDGVLLGYFGFLGEAKGIDVLLRVLPEAMARDRRLKLAMVGAMAGDSDPTQREYAREMRALADRLELSGRIVWTGFTTAAEVSRNLQACDLGVLPFREGASLRHSTLTAALVHGMAVITTSTAYTNSEACEPTYLPGPLRIRHRENAYLVPPGDERALRQAVLALADNPDMRAVLRRGASQMAPQFAWSSIAERVRAVYDQVA